MAGSDDRLRPPSPDDQSRNAKQISDAVNRSHREHFGRGAGSAKTIINHGFIVTFLEDIYTPSRGR